jgi:hypothetical protein
MSFTLRLKIKLNGFYIATKVASTSGPCPIWIFLLNLSSSSSLTLHLDQFCRPGTLRTPPDLEKNKGKLGEPRAGLTDNT